jgi:hypothetical protein
MRNAAAPRAPRSDFPSRVPIDQHQRRPMVGHVQQRTDCVNGCAPGFSTTSCGAAGCSYAAVRNLFMDLHDVSRGFRFLIPRPRSDVHRNLRRRVLPRSTSPDHPRTGAGTAGERDSRVFSRRYPPRTPRPLPDHQPAARERRASAVRTALQRAPPRSCPRPAAPPFPVRAITSYRTSDSATGSTDWMHEYQHVA